MMVADEAAAEALAEDEAAVAAADEAAAETVAKDEAAVAAAEQAATDGVAKAAATVSAASISVAEARVLRYLPTPLTFALIADKLGISRSAAKDRAARVYEKLGVHSRAEAVSRARALGLIE
jgi:DNA-binding CsgD family transcriptional regulator